ncbi:MAG: signal peptidase II [Ruminococcaceae bacterium]|nr:signal peptidase II [Oscillospiraceae bacterium]
MSKGRKANSINGLELMVMFVFLMFFLVVADQLIKKAIDFSMEYGSTIPVIENFFSLHYVRNTGSAFSFLADKPWGITALSIISAVLGGLVVIFMGVACAKHLKLLGFAFCLISAGAFGNLIDRVQLKYVIDYLRFDFGSYTFPIFNLADICAVVGTFILMGIIIFGQKYFDDFWGSSSKKKEEKKEKANDDGVRAPQVPFGDFEEKEEEKEEESEASDDEEAAPSLPYKVRSASINGYDGED